MTATDYDGVRYDTFNDGPPACACGRSADYDGRLCCLCAPAPREVPAPLAVLRAYGDAAAARGETITAIERCIACGQVSGATVTGRIGDTTGPLCADCAYWCDGNVAAPVCRACKLWEWSGDGELPYNPDAGACAHCGGNHAELYGGCCRDCYAAGYREACSRANCRR